MYFACHNKEEAVGLKCVSIWYVFVRMCFPVIREVHGRLILLEMANKYIIDREE